MNHNQVHVGQALAGKYRFIAEIGRGGMAEVFLAMAHGGLAGFEKVVVIKLLRTDMSDDEDFRRMFLDEARLAARLNHPNVVQTYDVGEHDGRYYLAMEYLEGQSFDKVRRARGAQARFDLRMQLHMLVHVLSGLHYAHELTDYDSTPLNVIHRDVTPSNILITYDGQVKLVDFGIAKALNSGNETRAGVFKGKTAYMAPEQFAFGSSIDRRVDIFSAGIVLWEMLAGRRMWKDLSGADRWQRLLTGHIQPLRDLVPGLSPELERICLKALAFKPDDRYATAAALQQELEAFLAEHPPRLSGRDLGNAIKDLFADERTKIHALIENQLKSSATGSNRLPVISQTGPGVARLVDDSAPSLPQPSFGRPQPTPLRRKRTVLMLGGIATALIALGTARLLAPSGNRATAAVAGRAGGSSTRPYNCGLSDHEIVFGMSGPLSGSAKEVGRGMKAGVELAFAAANEEGGVHGRQLRLIALDDGFEPSRTRETMQELLESRRVFAVIGNVGSATAAVAAPFALEKKVLFFGALSGSNALRRDPPDRYVFNYRPSYGEETAAVVRYLISQRSIKPTEIAVFAEEDEYGDVGFQGVADELRRKYHRDPTSILRVGFKRNTVDVQGAVDQIVASWDTKAVVMVAPYRAAARFVEQVKERRANDLIFTSVSDVGSAALAEEFMQGSKPRFAEGLIVTQAVPLPTSRSTIAIRYREMLQKYAPAEKPDFVSFEGYLTANLLIEALRQNGRNLDTESLVSTLEKLGRLDIGLGAPLSLGLSEHQASHKVWGTVLDAHGDYQMLDLD